VSTSGKNESTLNRGLQQAFGSIQFWFALLFVVGWSGVVGGGLAVQFIGSEYPCPLCMIQRVFMLLAAAGAAFIVVKWTKGTIEPRDYMTGWGLVIVACLVGAFTSWRQTMLHILPGDDGYGDPVLGLHLYVWALILFVVASLVAGLLLATSHLTAGAAPRSGSFALIGKIAIGLLMLILAINVVSVFALEGFHLKLPDDPTRYQLFEDLRLLFS
jgi:disulfide bond formation protein DsbB